MRIPPEPPVVNHRIAERSSPSRVRTAAPTAGAPLTAAGRSAAEIIATGGSGGILIRPGCVGSSHDLLAIHRPFLAVSGTATGNPGSLCATPSVSRPAGFPKLNLRGQHRAVPANGCLVPRWRGSNSERIAHRRSRSSSSDPFECFTKSSRQTQGDLCFPLTDPYHGCPRVPQLDGARAPGGAAAAAQTSLSFG